jgi:hypothetical protein
MLICDARAVGFTALPVGAMRSAVHAVPRHAPRVGDHARGWPSGRRPGGLLWMCLSEIGAMIAGASRPDAVQVPWRCHPHRCIHYVKRLGHSISWAGRGVQCIGVSCGRQRLAENVAELGALQMVMCTVVPAAPPAGLFACCLNIQPGSTVSRQTAAAAARRVSRMFAWQILGCNCRRC